MTLRVGNEGMDTADESLRYPIGRPPVLDGPATAAQRAERIASIEALPQRLRGEVRGLTTEQWSTPYRPDGWTVRQVVHHVPDSHLNAYIRFKLALTEEVPTIKPYDEAAWAKLPDSTATPPDLSLALLEALHARWVVLLGALPESAYAKRLRHPQHGRLFSLDEMLAQYAWHGEHHLAHIVSLRQRAGWSRPRHAGAAEAQEPYNAGHRPDATGSVYRVPSTW
jgi:hypothetical protein